MNNIIINENKISINIEIKNIKEDQELKINSNNKNETDYINLIDKYKKDILYTQLINSIEKNNIYIFLDLLWYVIIFNDIQNKMISTFKTQNKFVIIIYDKVTKHLYEIIIYNSPYGFFNNIININDIKIKNNLKDIVYKMIIENDNNNENNIINNNNDINNKILELKKLIDEKKNIEYVNKIDEKKTFEYINKEDDDYNIYIIILIIYVIILIILFIFILYNT